MKKHNESNKLISAWIAFVLAVPPAFGREYTATCERTEDTDPTPEHVEELNCAAQDSLEGTCAYREYLASQDKSSPTFSGNFAEKLIEMDQSGDFGSQKAYGDAIAAFGEIPKDYDQGENSLRRRFMENIAEARAKATKELKCPKGLEVQLDRRSRTFPLIGKNELRRVMVKEMGFSEFNAGRVFSDSDFSSPDAIAKLQTSQNFLAIARQYKEKTGNDLVATLKERSAKHLEEIVVASGERGIEGTVDSLGACDELSKATTPSLVSVSQREEPCSSSINAKHADNDERYDPSTLKPDDEFDACMVSMLKKGLPLKSIEVSASSSALNNTGEAAKNHCKRGFASLSKARVEDARETLLPKIFERIVNETNFPDAEERAKAAKILMGAKIDPKSAGKNGDGTSGKCPYKLVEREVPRNIERKPASEAVYVERNGKTYELTETVKLEYSTSNPKNIRASLDQAKKTEAKVYFAPSTQKAGSSFVQHTSLACRRIQFSCRK